MSELKQKIADVLSHFSQNDLFQSSIQFFETLGYNTERQLPLESPSFQNFKENYVKDNDKFNEQKAYTDNWKQVHLLFQLTEEELVSQHSLLKKNFKPEIAFSFLFFAIELNPKENNKPYTKTELSNITREVNKLFAMPAIILFKYDKLVTLSIINRRLNKIDKTKDVLEKVTLIKDIDITSPHRGHIEILHNLTFSYLVSQYIINNFEDLHKAWAKVLDTSLLNEAFYKDIANWYDYALKTIKLPIKPNFYKSDKENVKYFSVRLISRLLFSWFLKEMGLIDKILLEIKIDEKDKLFKNSSNDLKSFLEENNYYRKILQNIFFACLNTPINERKRFYFVEDINVNFELFKKIPYLNGGLFEKLEEDNCNDKIDDSKINIPNKLFYSENIDNKGIKGLNKIFESYKFTVSENTSFEEEVALDPELLGMIFENLLAAMDPDDIIAKSARNATGSFYTPRKIIEYMVDEALRLYFINYFKNKNMDTKSIDNLVYYEKCAEDDVIFRKMIVDAIDEIKILDPACGSGAFPMGMLHKLVRILKVVDKENKLWIEKQINRLPIELREQTKLELNKHETNYARKLGIIRNSIYSVDIQPMAVMISKLRFFISLLIEQNIDLNDKVHNYHISPLPNLETKIICANTLKDTAVQGHFFTEQVIKTLIKTREEYYQNKNLTNQQRNDLLNIIINSLNSVYPDFAQEITGKKIKDSTSKEVLNKKYLKEWFKHGNLSAPFFNMEVFFPELKGSGFDIVIGNPPYGGDKIPDEVKKNLELGSTDPYGAFIARFLGNGFDTNSTGRPTPLKTNGILVYIVSDTFMTIKTHFKLRKQMMKNKIYKMIRLHPDTFKATVNTAVIVCEKLSSNAKSVEDKHICTMADLTTVSIHERYNRFLELLYQTTDVRVDKFTEKESCELPVLKMKGNNWTSESSSEYAIYTYPQNLININSNLPFFVASPKLFWLMNDNYDPNNKVQVEWKNIKGKQVKIRTIPINNKIIQVVKLGDIAEVKVGLQTGDNQAYLFQNPNARGNYRSIENFKQFLLTEKDLEKIRNNNKLRLEVIDKGISKDNKKSNRYFGGRYIVPYDKGGASDAKEGWLPNYYVPTDYFIDWSEWAVNRMKTLTTKQRNKQYKKSGGDDRIASRFQNAETYFLEGITFSSRGVYSPTFRMKNYSLYDKESSCIFIDNIYNLLGLLNSFLNRYLFKNFIQHTISSDVDSVKLIISLINIDILQFVNKLIQKQKENPRYDYASNEQIEIDRLVYEAYGLNKEDIQEVENWYVRRYPNLKQTKKTSLKYNVIEKLKQEKTYFSYEEIKVLLDKQKIQMPPSSLKIYVSKLVKKNIIFDAGKGWYSVLERKIQLDTKPLRKIKSQIKNIFPLLPFACWSTEQLNSFTHHILSKFIIFIYTEIDYMKNLTDDLREKRYNVYENPNKAEIEKFVQLSDETIIIRPFISKEPENNDNFAPIEKILVDFLIENKKLMIMENLEAEQLITRVINSGRINISALISYSKRRKIDISKIIN